MLASTIGAAGSAFGWEYVDNWYFQNGLYIPDLLLERVLLGGFGAGLLGVGLRRIRERRTSDRLPSLVWAGAFHGLGVLVGILVQAWKKLA